MTLANFVAFARDPYYLRSLGNSLLLGLGTVAATSVVGFAVAFLLVRYDFVGRNLFGYLTLIPIISPPLVGVLGFTFIMGRAGTVNVLLEDWFGLARPLNFVYGLHGVLLVETLHLFPMITLNVVDALAKIDPALEEAAESVGARGFTKLVRITLPLTTPGYVAGALLVFIWTFSDFRHAAGARRPRSARVAGLSQHRPVRGSAVVPDGHRDLGAHGGPGRRVPGGGAPLRGDQGLFVALVLEGRAPAALAARPGRRRLVPVVPDALLLHPVSRRDPGVGGEGLVADAVSGALHLRLLRAGDRRDAEVHREQLALLGSRRRAVHRDRRADRVDPGAHAPARTGHARRAQHPDPGDPGTAIGIAYIRAFHFDLPFVDRGLTSLWIVLPLVLAIRRLPLHGTRLVRVAPARAPIHGGSRGERRRARTPLVRRRDACRSSGAASWWARSSRS